MSVDFPFNGAMTRELLNTTRAIGREKRTKMRPVIAASVQTQKDYTWRDIQFGRRFVEIYTEHGGGRLTVDYGRLHDTEPAE